MNQITMLERRMISPAEVERIFGVPRGSLANLRWMRKGPRYYKVGRRRVMYRLVDVKEWIESSPVQTLDSRSEV